MVVGIGAYGDRSVSRRDNSGNGGGMRMYMVCGVLDTTAAPFAAGVDPLSR